MKIFFRQTVLTKQIDHAIIKQVAWIPEKWCKIGQVLRIKDSFGEWEDGWVVKSFGDSRRLEDDLPDTHNEIKGHRKNTGDSLPKRRG